MNLNKPDYAGKSASELIEIFEAQIAAKKRTTVRVKTSDLQGAALDWAVAKCEGRPHSYAVVDVKGQPPLKAVTFTPSTDWAQAGPIVERQEIAIWPDEEGGFLASADEGAGTDYHGESYLIAAMRCYVASQLGAEVDVPVELIEETA